MYDAHLLSAALDDAAFPILDEMMDYFTPDPPFLTFGAPGAARALSVYGRTVLAGRDIFYDPFKGNREEGIEVRTAGPEDPMVFPPRRFGLVHARWTSYGGNVLRNMTRWIKPGGVLLIEAPDCYPASSVANGPYRTVSEAVVKRMGSPTAEILPSLLIKHGLDFVGSRHQLPVTAAFHALLQNLIEQGSPWPEVSEGDLRDWPNDPASRTPALTNVLVWGVKPGENFSSPA